MNVLVTFALEQEFAPWRKLRRFAAVPVADLTLHQARIGAAHVSVLLAGVGPDKAGANVKRAMMGNADPGRFFDACIVAGLAGGLRPVHRPGDVLAARAALASAEVRGSRQDDVVCLDADLVGLAELAGAKCVERFYTQARVSDSAAEKARLGEFADAVDMETFEVARQGWAWGARPSAIRAVSDAVEEDLPYDFNRFFDQPGRVSRARALAQIARRPQRIAALVRFARRSRRAAENLCAFLDRYVQALAEQGTGAQDRELDEVAAT